MIRAGFIGMGLMGRRHAENLLQMENAKIVALCSDPIDNAEDFKKEKNLNVNIYDNGFKMIENETLDLLYICIPPFAHSGQLEYAAEKGIHVFVEKPIAHTVERAKSMVEAVHKFGIYTQVGYHMRFGGAVQKFLEMLNNGTAGKPLLFTAHYECNSEHTPWWRDVNKSGGQVFEQVIHLYDMAINIMGDIVSVGGHIANLNHTHIKDYTVEDTSIANLVFSNGAMGSITGSNCAVKNEWNARFRVVCQHMIANFEDHNTAEFIYTNTDEKITENIHCDDNAILNEDKYFLSVVEGKNKPIATLTDGLKGLQTVSSVVTSSLKQGNTIII
ncbi:MAG: Gfo/Idh/MocA family oxidoreductase [Spirochaetales bacterium]